MHAQGTAHVAVAPAARRSGPVKGPLEQVPPRSRAHASLERVPPRSRAHAALERGAARGLISASLEAPSRARLLPHTGTGI
jgi:hypothetical protein